MSKLNKIRAFICFKLPKRLISSIGRIQESVKQYELKIRWVRPENIHLTIKFLGDISWSDIDDIEMAIKETAADFAPLLLSAQVLGVFPNIKRPRVIWIGLSGQVEELIGLQRMLDKKLRLIGFPKEKRPFKGHLTIGRVKGRLDARQLSDIISRFNKFETKQFSGDKIFLIQSELKPSGPIYTKLMSESL
ncbi:MAG: RNA 2',3'-cyclic phosphodiesterase [Deltaproteobacteria bacterium]|nr:RNA 2',3'-cyclic phosphodiesterase [Deltaproteobacteria bacterium]